MKACIQTREETQSGIETKLGKFVITSRDAAEWLHSAKKFSPGWRRSSSRRERKDSLLDDVLAR